MRKGIVLACLGIVVLIAAAVGAHHAWGLHQLHTLEAELRAAGLPLTAEELPGAESSPSDPESDPLSHAAAEYQRQAQRVSDPNTAAIRYTRDLREQDRQGVQIVHAKADELLTAYETFLHLIEQSVHAGAPRSSGARSGPSPPQDAVTRLQAQPMIGLRVTLASLRGNHERALTDAITMKGNANQLGHLPFYQVSLQEDAFSATGQLLSHTQLTPAELDELAAPWQGDDQRFALQSIWPHVFCAALASPAKRVIDELRKSNYAYLARLYPASTPLNRFYRYLYHPREPLYALHAPGDRMAMLQLYRDAMAIAEQPTEAWCDATIALAEDGQVAPPGYLKTHLIARHLEEIAVAATGAVARGRLVTLATAIERYRYDTHTLPETTADLVPDYLQAIPRDPFNGSIMTYRRESQRGYTLLSARENEFTDSSAPRWSVILRIER